jgi:5-methylcytosine-specific restriction endonuclease McrA
MLKNNIYNIDKEFDYSAVKAIVVKSLEKILKQESLRDVSTISNHILPDTKEDGNNLPAPPTPLLKLKIRNTTKYLNWRLSILKRDNFTCKICHASVKENKSLRLEVHHTKSFDDICKENSVAAIEQAFECKELWSVSNGISICYRCHKDVEKLRTKLRNMFRLDNVYTVGLMLCLGSSAW